jgi:hypothetical protein
VSVLIKEKLWKLHRLSDGLVVRNYLARLAADCKG